MIGSRLIQRGLFAGAVAILMSGFAPAEPTTQPSPSNPPQRAAFGAGGGARGEMMLQRLRDGMADLNLTEEQKSKVADIFAKAKDDMREMVPQLQNMDQQDRQAKVREFMMGLRDNVRGVLTEEQAQKFQEKIQNLRRGPGDGNRAAPAAGAGAPPAPPAEQTVRLPQRIQQTLERLQESLKTIELSDDQKRQVQSIVDDGKKQLMEMGDKVQAGTMKAEELRSEAPQVFAAMRDQLAGVLTRDQQEKLRDAIQSRFDRDNAPPAPATKPAMMKTDPFENTPKPEREQNSREGPAAKPQALAPPDTGPKIGATAPEFSLEGLNGRTVQLSSFKAKPLVVEFGSYTSPSFRQRAAKMEELARQYSTRANFLIVYTKEAHAMGEWEVDRNRDEGVRVAKHADAAARKTAAKDAKQALRITIPIAMDDMNDGIASAYGAGENSAVVIGRDGTVVSRQAWCDPFRLRTALDEAVTSHPTTAP